MSRRPRRLAALVVLAAAALVTPSAAATAQDGAPLDAQGPRLVVPGDIKGGRYVSTVTQVYVGDVDRLVH
jgi:hypothetical protein